MPTGLTPSQRSIRARIGALALHAKHDTLVVSQAGRDAFMQRFLDEVDPNLELPVQERERRARYARSAYFTKMALQRELKKSAKKQRNADSAGTEPASAEIAAGGADRVSDDQQLEPA